jgi:hypothetical protein
MPLPMFRATHRLFRMLTTMPLLDTPLLLDFEVSSCENFTYIPLAVRYNLDRFGVRISLTQWQTLPHADRELLARFPLDDDPQIERRFDQALAEMLRTHLSGESPIPAPDMSPAWQRTDAVPDALLKQCSLAGVAPVSVARWATLPLFHRYVLAKLSRKPVANHDFIPAMKSFGLI